MSHRIGKRVNDDQLIITDQNGSELELNLHQNARHTTGGFAWTDNQKGALAGVGLKRDDLVALRDFLNEHLT